MNNSDFNENESINESNNYLSKNHISNLNEEELDNENEDNFKNNKVDNYSEMINLFVSFDNNKFEKIKVEMNKNDNFDDLKDRIRKVVNVYDEELIILYNDKSDNELMSIENNQNEELYEINADGNILIEEIFSNNDNIVCVFKQDSNYKNKQTNNYNENYNELLDENKNIESFNNDDISHNIQDSINEKRKITKVESTKNIFQYTAILIYDTKVNKINFRSNTTINELFDMVYQQFINLTKNIKILFNNNDILENYDINDKIEKINNDNETTYIFIIKENENKEINIKTSNIIDQKVDYSKKKNIILEDNKKENPIIFQDIYNQDKSILNINNQIFSQNHNNPNKYQLIQSCLCRKDDALNVCLKCNINICEFCKKSEHYTHIDSVIKVSKFKDHVKTKIIELMNKLQSNIVDNETFIYLEGFDYNFKIDLERIDKVYTYMHSILEDIKNLQVTYIVEMVNRMNFNEKFEEITTKLKDIDDFYKSRMNSSKSFFNFNGINERTDKNETLEEKINLDELTPEGLLKEKIIIDSHQQVSINKFKYLNSLFQIYVTAITTIETLNYDISSNLKEIFLQSSKPFNLNSLNTHINKFMSGGNNKKNKYFDNPAVMRFLSSTNVLYIKPKNVMDYFFNKDSKIQNVNEINELKIRNIRIPENDAFKQNFQNSDEVELIIENLLFVVTGKKYNLFFCFDFSKNEIIHLEDLNNSHHYGLLIYSHLNNSIYCIGGINSKKCEFYRNDSLVFPSSAIVNPHLNETQQTIKIKSQNWNNGPDMNIYRQEFAGMIVNNYLYVFFGFNNLTSLNNNTVERLNVLKNDKWEIIPYSNPSNLNIGLSGHGICKKSEVEILIFGGFDGKVYKDNIILYNLLTSSFFSTNRKIPSLKKYSFFQFFKQPELKGYSNDLSLELNKKDNAKKEPFYDFFAFDSKNILHYVNTKKFKYEFIDSNQKII